ncbi:MAG: FMN-binding protein [Bacteroidia bacterium]|nr:FMN-binding protein [Bacteroidia bacterium]NNJ54522.1 FMN-binding protein [Bacteroidia bacterium]
MNDVKHITPEKEPSSFKLISTLGIAGFLSGLILVSVYLFTKPYIAQNRADALQAAVFEVLPGTTYFEKMYWDGSNITSFEGSVETDIELIYFGYDSTKQFTGVAISGEAGGYQDVIMALAGYNPDAEIVIGLKVLESKETPGLGDKIILDDDFQENFKQLAVVPEIEVVKKGEKVSDNQIEAITGATISSKTIGKLLQKSMETWKVRIDNYFESNAKVNNDED